MSSRGGAVRRPGSGMRPSHRSGPRDNTRISALCFAFPPGTDASHSFVAAVHHLNGSATCADIWLRLGA
jgi:hypothetical protein